MCDREYLSIQSNERASRKARADTRIAEERQTEHHRLPDRLPKSVTVVRRDKRPRTTTTVTVRKSPLPEERLSRRRRHERAEAVQGARAVRQKELVNDSNGTT